MTSAPVLRQFALALQYVNFHAPFDDNGYTISIPRTRTMASNRSFVLAGRRRRRTNLPSKDHLPQTRSRTIASSILWSSLPLRTSLQQSSKQTPKRLADPLRISLACLHRASEIIYCLLGSSKWLLLTTFDQYLLSSPQRPCK